MRGAGAKDGIGNTAVDETGSAIEPQRVEVCCHLQAFRTPHSQNPRDMVDERGGNSTLHPSWSSRSQNQVFRMGQQVARVTALDNDALR
jgi:hypothetical protein